MQSRERIYDHGDLYDLLYRDGGKDYRAEADIVSDLITERRPDASAVLDVGCGTGGHLRRLTEHFDTVEGMDRAEGMLQVCRRELPDIRVHHADMRDFDLGRRFDAVVSLFNVVGNVADSAELDATLSALMRHLAPGGVVVVEPWWFDEQFTDGHIGSSTVTVGDTTVARLSHSVRDAGRTRMEVHCLIGTRGNGLQHVSYQHDMALFTRDQYEAAFARAGCPVTYIGGAYPGPGLFVGVRQDGARRSPTVSGRRASDQRERR
ncbi:class I SAM-dependent methyltransferase [Nocardiopsis halophila]|uniref:class I SAM-dependent methyltransferase n=1 Tax=Nocardiopsis halophila TaxID=141692 RepID=UPI0006874F4E|nr:class I SAM-dependent methyltransferase [Nocardiopsis halophila]